MAKTTRKGTFLGHKSSISHKLNPRFYPRAKARGKRLHAYQFNQPRNRKLSIAESTSSDSSDGLAGNGRYLHARPGSVSGSDSDSSLTAMSEEHEKVASRKGAVFFDLSSLSMSAKKGRSVKSAKPARPSKSFKSSRKGHSGKSFYCNAVLSAEDALEDDEEVDPLLHIEGDEDINEDDDNDDDEVGLEAIYSMVGGKTSYMFSHSEDSNDDDSQDEMDLSSSDGSEVDFVRMQVEHRKNTEQKNPGKASVGFDKGKLKRRKSSVHQRRSEVAIPENGSFKFEFDGPIAELAIDDHRDENISSTAAPKKKKKVEEEEDLGEELLSGNKPQSFDFHFNQPLIDVPKINDDDLNSDDEFDFDDNDLLATLQADNDFEDFMTKASNSTPKVRQGSLSSLNDDENKDSFLKEEEKYLVNEFETHGFDAEGEVDAGRMETAHAMTSLQEMDGLLPQDTQALEYASSSDEKLHLSEDEADYNYDEDDEYVDFVDFELPFFDESDNRNAESTKVKGITLLKEPMYQHKQKKSHFPKKKRGPLDSDDEDDSYLWNYFFSSDAESHSDNELDQYDADEQLILEEVFRQNLEDRRKQMERESSLEPVDSDQDHDYDSGESTDVDLSLPPSSANGNMGLKLAKEVLSSKTADYRPPVLGTWASLDSKPFGIIDGLSTRMLNSSGSTKNRRTRNWRGLAAKSTAEELTIELEELLNVSELDNDDENDVRIWRDFTNNKKHVPLGAFRNKAHITHPIVVTDPMTSYNVSKNTNYNRRRRYLNSHVKARLAQRNHLHPVGPVLTLVTAAAATAATASLTKDLNLPSKLKVRRTSMADAVSEGYQPTKSGQFSENVLADVDEVLGDDRDFMALITGL